MCLRVLTCAFSVRVVRNRSWLTSSLATTQFVDSNTFNTERFVSRVSVNYCTYCPPHHTSASYPLPYIIIPTSKSFYPAYVLIEPRSCSLHHAALFLFCYKSKKKFHFATWLAFLTCLYSFSFCLPMAYPHTLSRLLSISKVYRIVEF